MANMSYCRFQNTELDLRDCVNALGEAYELEEVDLSNDEQRAMNRMKQLCEDFLAEVERLEKMSKENAE